MGRAVFYAKTPGLGGGRGLGLEFPESVTNQEEKVCILSRPGSEGDHCARHTGNGAVHCAALSVLDIRTAG